MLQGGQQDERRQPHAVPLGRGEEGGRWWWAQMAQRLGGGPAKELTVWPEVSIGDLLPCIPFLSAVQATQEI